MKRIYYLQRTTVNGEKMTEKEAINIIEKIKHDYFKDNDEVKARNDLQEFFDTCFPEYPENEKLKPALSRAYSLLRRIENEKTEVRPSGYRYDISFAAEGLVFCAETLLNRTGKRFVFDYGAGSAFINTELKCICRVILSLLANAAKYAESPAISVKLSAFDGFVCLNVTNGGSFEPADFQKAVKGGGSLGFVNRVLSQNGGSLVMSSAGGKVSLAFKLPLCREDLPVILPFAVEDLLYDRLSAVYVAFCGH